MSVAEMLARSASILRRASKSWGLLSLSLVLGAAAAWYVPRNLVKPLYRSEAAVLYQEGLQMSSIVGNRELDSRKHAAAMLEEVVRSRASLEHVIEKVNPYPGMLQSRGSFEAVQNLRSNIKLRVKNDTFVMSFDGDNPDVVYGVMQTLVDRLSTENERLRGEKVSSTMQFLEREKQQAQQELEQREQALAAFMAAHPDFAQDPAATLGATAAGASIRAAERQRIKEPALSGDPTGQALARRAAYLSRLLQGESPQSSRGPAAPVDPEAAAAMSQAKAELTAAQRDLADKRSRYTDQHPDVVAAVQKVQHATAKLERARPAAQTTADANPYADGAPRSKEDISAELARVQAQLAARRSGQAGASTAAAPAAAPGTGIVALETEWVSLNRAVGAARDRHGQLQDRLFSATMLASAESTGNAHRLVVLDPPYRPTRPAARGPRTVAVVSFALLLMAGIAAAIVKAALDRTLREELDLKRLRFCTLRHVVPASAGASEATS